MAEQVQPPKPSEGLFPPTSDYEFVLRHSALKGYQALSLITPPAYVVYSIFQARRGKGRLSINGLLRTTWIGGAAGTGLGAAAAVGRLRGATPESIHDRKMRLQYNESQVRVDGLSLVGSWIMGVITPAIFWSHARLINLVLGGAGLGNAAGVLAHLTMSWKEGESVKPEGMRDTVKGE